MDRNFIGFSFDGIHSSELNIFHVSSSDRYEETLQPEINDNTIEIPGLDGEYYFGSTYGPKEIEVNIAFDSMTEVQFRKMRGLFGTKKICELIFDERPYKVYLAKIKSPISIEYICFDEEIKLLDEERDGLRYTGIGRSTVGLDGVGRVKEKIIPYKHTGKKQRIYKGEAKIEFICYFPFAKQLFKQLDLYNGNGNTFTKYNNVNEWAESSRLLTIEEFNKYKIDRLLPNDSPQELNYKIPVYNPGDIDTGFFLYLPFVTEDGSKGLYPNSTGNYIEIFGDDNGLMLRPITAPKHSSDTGILINTNNHLIQGVHISNPLINDINNRRANWWTYTGTLYNEYIAAGDFPHIKRVDWYFDNKEQFKQAIYLNCDLNGEEENVLIKYDYLYF